MLDLSALSTVTVVDDDAEDRNALVEDLADFGFETRVIEGKYASDMDRLVADIHRLKSDFVICDHKLQPHQLASFTGAELVARLFQDRVPSMLLTMFKSPARVDILKHRERIPVVVGRDEFDQAHLPKYLSLCRSEFDGKPVPSRKPHRVIVRVEDKRSFGKSDFVCDVVIPSWRPGHAITVPKECFSKNFWSSIAQGDRFLGNVNIEAPDEDELFISELEERIDINE